MGEASIEILLKYSLYLLCLTIYQKLAMFILDVLVLLDVFGVVLVRLCKSVDKMFRA